jgi:hypothetical protein
VPAAIFTVEDILAAYPAIDGAASIRSFLQEAHALWGSSFALLGGDTPWVPTRWAWAMDCEAGFAPDENEIHTDLYFSDLDGSWDADGDGIYGETADSIDLAPDLYVGRLPARSAAQAQICVEKILDYERDTPTLHATQVLFAAELLWTDPYTDSGIGKNMLDDLHFGPEFDPLTKLYESLGNESRASVIAGLNAGPHFFNHCGHAWYNVMTVGAGSLYISDADNLGNGANTFLAYSIGCWAAALDKDAIAEHFVTSANGGAVAFVGNSRYGWGAPGIPGMGYSERFDRDFFGALLSAGVTQLGVALAEAKLRILPYSHEENVYRWHQYQVNLLGDPELAVHTREPAALTLAAPAELPVGESFLTIHVGDASGPVAGARVCISGDPEVYLVGWTDGLGCVRCSLATTAAHELGIVATAQDHLPVEAALQMAGEAAPALAHLASRVDDDAQGTSLGNGNGEVNPGERVELALALQNIGALAAGGVTATLAESDPYVTILDGVEAWPDLAPGESAFCLEDFDLEISSSCPPGRVLELALEIAAIPAGGGAGLAWSERVALAVVAPDPAIVSLRVLEAAGDGDGIAEPGERVALLLRACNQGTGTLAPATAGLVSGDANVTLLETSSVIEDSLAADACAHLLPLFEILISPACPVPHVVPLTVQLSNGDGTLERGCELIVGETGLQDDVEAGPDGWTHAGTGDAWHISTYRAHSGSASWYCGEEAAHQYPNGMDASLSSPWITLPPQAELRFWRYFNVTIYGSDGLFIEIDDGSGWSVLDYLGSGGALEDSTTAGTPETGSDAGDPGTLFASDWAEMAYPLDGYVAGTQVRIRFRMATDAADQDEGFYVDDISIGSATPASTDVADEVRAARLRLQAPNPLAGGRGFAERGTIRFSIPGAGPVRLTLRDLSGRLVGTLVDGWLAAGEHLVPWDGRDRQGRPLPAGVYFLGLEARGEGLNRPVVVLK